MIRVPDNKVACIPIFDRETTHSGLYIPEAARGRCNQGIVKYIGPKVEQVRPGDFVLFSGYTGTLVRFESDGLLIFLPEDFITAIIEAKATPLPGLYFKDKSGEYFEATYETALDIIKDSLERSEWLTELNRRALVNRKWKGTSWVITHRPPIGDYDK